jgi:hypothetical protein
VFIAIIIASVVAWYFMDQWLDRFAYKIELTWVTFVLVGFAAVVTAVVTVSSQAIKAGLSDPVKALRSE